MSDAEPTRMTIERETVTVPRGAEWYVGLETSGEREGQMGLWIRYADKDDCKAAMKAMFADAAPTPPLGGQGSSSLKGEDTHRDAERAVVGDWSEFEDDLSDAIGDSIDMGWNSGDGARAVVRWLNENAPRKPDRPRR